MLLRLKFNTDFQKIHRRAADNARVETNFFTSIIKDEFHLARGCRNSFLSMWTKKRFTKCRFQIYWKKKP